MQERRAERRLAAILASQRRTARSSDAEPSLATVRSMSARTRSATGLKRRASAVSHARDARPSSGSGRSVTNPAASTARTLIPLYEEDGLRLGELAQRVQLTKQTMTTIAPTRRTA
jgi:hypothetical protein